MLRKEQQRQNVVLVGNSLETKEEEAKPDVKPGVDVRYFEQIIEKARKKDLVDLQAKFEAMEKARERAREKEREKKREKERQEELAKKEKRRQKKLAKKAEEERNEYKHLQLMMNVEAKLGFNPVVSHLPSMEVMNSQCELQNVFGILNSISPVIGSSPFASRLDSTLAPSLPLVNVAFESKLDVLAFKQFFIICVTEAMDCVNINDDDL